MKVPDTATSRHTTAQTREQQMTSLAPDWTPAPSKPASASYSTRVGSGADSGDIRTPPDGSPRYFLFENAFAWLQKRSMRKFSTLLLVGTLMALTIGSMAYGLLSLPNADGF